MKKIIALCLVTLTVVLMVAVRHSGTETRTVESSAATQDTPEAREVSASTVTVRPTLSLAANLLSSINAETDADSRAAALEQAVESVPPTAMRSVLDALARDTRPAAAELRPLLARRWAEANAPAAAAWAAQLPEGLAKRSAVEQVVLAWVDKDLVAASDWAETLPAGESKQAALLDIAYDTARTEPLTALDLAHEMTPSRERDDLVVHAVSQWAGTDRVAATAWALSVQDTNLRQRLVSAVAVASTDQDASGAATLAVQSLVGGDEQDRAAVGVVERWAQTSPEVAAAWVMQFPDTTMRNAAAQNLVALWTAQDSAAAGTWVRSLPEGPLKTTGMAAYAQALATATVKIPQGN